MSFYGEVQYPFQPTGIYFAVGPITLHEFHHDDPPDGRPDHRAVIRVPIRRTPSPSLWRSYPCASACGGISA